MGMYNDPHPARYVQLRSQAPQRTQAVMMLIFQLGNAGANKSDVIHIERLNQTTCIRKKRCSGLSWLQDLGYLAHPSSHKENPISLKATYL